MDLGHHIWKLGIGGQLFKAPVKAPHRIIDLGCGTGIWAIEAGLTPHVSRLGADNA